MDLVSLPLGGWEPVCEGQIARDEGSLGGQLPVAVAGDRAVALEGPCTRPNALRCGRRLRPRVPQERRSAPGREPPHRQGPWGQTWGVRTCPATRERQDTPAFPPTDWGTHGRRPLPRPASCRWARPPGEPAGVESREGGSLLHPQVWPRGTVRKQSEPRPPGLAPAGSPRAWPGGEQISARPPANRPYRGQDVVSGGAGRPGALGPHPQPGSGRVTGWPTGHRPGPAFLLLGQEGPRSGGKGATAQRWGAVKRGEWWGVGEVGAWGLAEGAGPVGLPIRSLPAGATRVQAG